MVSSIGHALHHHGPLIRLIYINTGIRNRNTPTRLVRNLHHTTTVAPTPSYVLLIHNNNSFRSLVAFGSRRLTHTITTYPIPIIANVNRRPSASVYSVIDSHHTSAPATTTRSITPTVARLTSILRTHRRHLNTTVTSVVKSGRISLRVLSRHNHHT